jgi:hypothetical protein
VEGNSRFVQFEDIKAANKKRLRSHGLPQAPPQVTTPPTQVTTPLPPPHVTTQSAPAHVTTPPVPDQETALLTSQEKSPHRAISLSLIVLYG